jgi:hypothetical protein
MSFSSTSDLKYELLLLTAIAGIGGGIKLFFGQIPSSPNSKNKTPAEASVYGYGAIAVSLLSILFITLALASKETMSNQTIGRFLAAIMDSSLPILLFLGVLLVLISLYIKYKKIINSGNTSKQFRLFGNISTVLVLINLILVYKYIYQQINASRTMGLKSKVPSAMFTSNASQLSAASLVLTAFNYMMTMAMQVSLAYFSTDG